MFEEALIEMLHQHRPNEVIFETVYSRFPKAAEPLYKVLGIIQLTTIKVMRKEAVGIHVETVRSLLKCKDKETVRKKVNERFGLGIPADQLDQSDAVAIAWAGFTKVREKK